LRTARSRSCGYPIRGRLERSRPDTVVDVAHTNPPRTVAVDLNAPEGRDNVVVLLVGSIGIAGLLVMLAIDVLVFSAF
jgi:hypothetical protein